MFFAHFMTPNSTSKMSDEILRRIEALERKDRRKTRLINDLISSNEDLKASNEDLSRRLQAAEKELAQIHIRDLIKLFRRHVVAAFKDLVPLPKTGASDNYYGKHGNYDSLVNLILNPRPNEQVRKKLEEMTKMFPEYALTLRFSMTDQETTFHKLAHSLEGFSINSNRTQDDTITITDASPYLVSCLD